MALIVQKYGGSSVAMRTHPNVAKRVAAVKTGRPVTRRLAMGDATAT